MSSLQSPLSVEKHTTLIAQPVLTDDQYRVLGYNDLTGPHSDLAVVLKFAPRVFGGSIGLKICMAISALGNILAVTYTASKGQHSTFPHQCLHG